MLALLVSALFVNAVYGCSEADLLGVYTRTSQVNENCDAFTQILGPVILSGSRPSQNTLRTLCSDDCTLHFVWSLYSEPGCTAQANIREVYDDILSVCGCRIDSFFLDNGGRCVTGASCDGCDNDSSSNDDSFDAPYISTRSGHAIEMHIAGAKLTLESGQSTGRSAGSSVDGDGVGFCDGAYVQWDEEREQCMPRIEYMAAGTRLLPFSDLVEQRDVDRLEERINADAAATLAVARELIVANEAAVRDSLSEVSGIASQFEVMLDDLSDAVEDQLEDVGEQLAASVAESVQSMTNVVDEMAACSAKGMLFTNDGCVAPFASEEDACDEDHVLRTRYVETDEEKAVYVCAPPNELETEYRWVQFMDFSGSRESCKVIKDADPSAESGVYTIKPGSSEEFETYCDMETNNGGWTLVATVHEDNIGCKCCSGDRWSSTQGNRHGAWRGDDNWGNQETFGTVQRATRDDYKNPAWWELEGKNVLIAHVRNDAAVSGYGNPWMSYYTTSNFLESGSDAQNQGRGAFEPHNLYGLYRRYPVASHQAPTSYWAGNVQRITYGAGNAGTMWSEIPPNSRSHDMCGQQDRMNYITFIKYNWEQDVSAFCPSNYRGSCHNNAEHMCIGGGGYFHSTAHCGDFGWYDHSGNRQWGQGSTGWSPAGRMSQSTYFFYVR